MTSVIKVENLDKRYGENVVLKDISFEVKKGEIFALLGTNGAGKTTTLECIEGVRKFENGHIYIDGKIGVQLQTTSLPQNIKIIEVLTLFSKWNSSKIDKGFIERIGLDIIKNKQYLELSIGQKRKLHLALALIGDPDIIILDEPTAGLDPRGRDEILGEILKLYKDQNMTVILVSHNMEDIAKLVNRILVMDNGKIAMDDIPLEIFKRADELKQIGLGVPQITEFMKRFYEKQGKANKEKIVDTVLTVEQAKEEILRFLRSNKDA